MIIYNPQFILPQRLRQAKQIVEQIPAKYCFITGSFLYKEKYKDIDVFVITRSKKEIILKNKKIKITRIDFNDLYSLFYHSISQSCIAKNILLTKSLKVTLADYWQVINEAIPTLLNDKHHFQKNIRFLILYTEYFKTNKVLDTFQLNEKINSFQDYTQVMAYLKQELPSIINKSAKPSYVKRFFYTQAGYYRDILYYDAQKFLYMLTHEITKNIAHG